MDFNDTPEEAAWRQEFRAWLEENAPKVTGEVPEHEQELEIARRRLHGACQALAGPEVRRRARAHHVGAGVRRPQRHVGRVDRLQPGGGQVPRPERALHHRPGHDRPDAARASAPTRRRAATSPSCCAARRSGRSCSANRARAPTWHHSRPPRRATATSGSSTGRRCGRRARSTPTTARSCAAPTPTPRSTRASPRSSSTCARRAVTIKPLKQMNGGSGFNEVFFDDVRVPHENVLGDVNEGWTVAITTLMNERVAIGSGGGGGGRRRHPRHHRPRGAARRERRPARAPAARRPLHEEPHPEVPLDAHAHRRDEGQDARTGRLDRQAARRPHDDRDGRAHDGDRGTERHRGRAALLAGERSARPRVTSRAAPTR